MSEQTEVTDAPVIKKKLTIDQGKPKYDKPGDDNKNKDDNLSETPTIVKGLEADSKIYMTKYWDTVGFNKAQEVAKAASEFDEFEVEIAQASEDIKKPAIYSKEKFKYHRVTMGQYDYIAGKKAKLIDIDRMSALSLKEYVDQKVAIPENFDKFRAMRKEAEVGYYQEAAQMYLGMTEEQVNNSDRVMLEFWVDVCEHKQINPKLQIPQRPSSTYT